MKPASLTLGVIFGNRDFFPDRLVPDARADILKLLGELGIEAVRRIDEKVNRRAGSEKSYTFHGRDIYAYTGARLAAGKITYEQVGPVLEPKVISLPYERASRKGGVLSGGQQHGQPLDEHGKPVPFCLCVLGKCGGFDSDILAGMLWASGFSGHDG